MMEFYWNKNPNLYKDTQFLVFNEFHKSYVVMNSQDFKIIDDINTIELLNDEFIKIDGKNEFSNLNCLDINISNEDN